MPREIRWCVWLRCATCRRVTTHAVLQHAVDSAGQCVMERANSEVDDARRRVRRLVAGLEADGVQVEWTSSSPGEFRDGAPSTLAIELRTADVPSKLVVIAWIEASPVQQLKALEFAVQLIDDPIRHYELRSPGIIVR